MRTVQRPEKEKGQVIILVALAMLAMLAMLGLAIDGGGLFFLQRDVQNTVDHSIVAASYARCAINDPATEWYKVENAVYDASEDHGFENGVDGVVVDVVQGPDGNTDEYIGVTITAPKPSFFIQILGYDDLEVSASGVGRCRIETYDFDPFTNRAMVALGGNSVCGGTGFEVNSTGWTQYIEGIYSNGDLKIQGSGVTVPGEISASGTTNIAGSATDGSGGSVTAEEVDEMPLDAFPVLFEVADYAPGGKYAPGGSDAVAHYTSYASDVTLRDADSPLSGLIYVDGTVTLNQATIDDSIGVTFVATGGIRVVNNVSDQNFHSYFEVTHTPADTTDDLVMFTSYDGVAAGCSGFSTNDIQFAGPRHDVRGVIYAPRSYITISGSETTVCGAVIALQVNPSGSDQRYEYCSYDPPTEPIETRTGVLAE